ncbi:sensor histidine kinase [Devosia sediminis]|uniref:histidine kinase n=1 Tax=Devosia sediminis TaxID=2798801 RepID=A0A934MPC7_9HYPH|nr:ATP-binding protein [Devosia sediminis]MBJ3783184.1 sensor histidine kinase [Devosia sediminis]
MAKRPTNWRALFAPRHLVGAAVAAVLVLVVFWVAFELTLSAAVREVETQAQRRLALFDRTLEAIIERYHYLPVAISQAPETRAALEQPANAAAVEAANGFLSQLNETAGASEIFLMEDTGSVVAASNWWTLTSLVGTNYSFRPYFADAMARGRAEYYAFGISTSVPGLFLSQRVEGPDGPLGVAVTKINLGEIEAAWWRSGELIGIVDLNEVVILSTRPDWRYRPLQTIPRSQFAAIASQQRYGENGVDNFGIITDRWFSRGAEFALLAGADPETTGYFVLNELRLPKHGWRLVSFSPLAPLYGGALTMATAAALACAALLLIIVLFEQRRRLVAQRLADHDQLELRVAERTEDLHAMNEQLRAEIADRIRAEKAEADAQQGLVQAAKLATLGQTLAGVAHEVSQPVAALATHMASARLIEQRRGGTEMGPILSAMDKVVERLAALTGHLKTFSRKQTRVAMEADVGTVISNALDLTDHRLRQVGVDVEYRRPHPPIQVAANPVHCEQVLINLIANAADAMQDTPMRVLSIGVTSEGGTVSISIADTGTGIAETDMATLFDPFFTTKPSGKGLGLGLAISYGLVRDSDGTITVRSREGQGSTFVVSLPLVGTAGAAAPSLPSPLRRGTEGGGPSVSHKTTPTPALPSRGRGRKASNS